MSTYIKSPSEYEDLFADFVQATLGLNDNQVLISYSTKGQKSSAITEDVCYVNCDITEEETGKFKNRSESYNSVKEEYTISQSAMNVVKLLVTFYGPNASALAIQLNEKLYFESSRLFFETNKLGLIPERTRLSEKIHENINERWWDRNDVEVYFYTLVSVDEVLYPIKSLDLDLKISK